MKVEKGSDYKLIFSITVHPYLGVLIEPVVIQLTSSSTLSLTYQRVFSGNATYYEKLSDEQLEWIKILDPIRPEQVVKLFSPVDKIRPKEYFHKHFNREQFRNEIRPYIESFLSQLLKKLPAGKGLLYRADEINPAAEEIEITPDFSTVLFHFRRNEFGTKYFLTIKYEDERIPFMKLGSLLLTNQPAFLIAQNKLLKFFDFVEGSKINVFVNRKYVLIKPEQEEEYYQNFITKLLERYPVYAQGFQINTDKREGKAKLRLSMSDLENSAFQLIMQYGDDEFLYHPTKFFHVKLSTANDFVFTKVRRSVQWEESKVMTIMKLGLTHVSDEVFLPESKHGFALIEWLSKNRKNLQAADIDIEFSQNRIFNLEPAHLNYTVNEDRDWFDLRVRVKIGDEEYPFSTFLKHIKSGERVFELKNGSFFLIPESWFAIGEKLSRFKSGTAFRLNKFQIDVLDIIPEKKVDGHLKSLISIEKETPSKKFKGTLRPYQLDGLSWLMFLYKNRFGGILADDMGLGKTVQTLAFLQKIYPDAKKEKSGPILLVAPTSLLYNWSQESEQFTPEFKVHIHNGPFRTKNANSLTKYDIVITSYGLVRNDFDMLSELEFFYLILDESQNIKNRNAKATQKVNRLNAQHRLCLTGTPIENSVKDLWSQMNFLNKGLLGSSAYFEDQYVKPIEKNKDPDKTEELRTLVKPFVLRRTKDQVAKDLPDISEKTIICPMVPEQKDLYEEIKSEYRNRLLNLVDEQGIDKSRMSILQGLTKLRQIANHPGLVEEQWMHGSGKHGLLLQYVQTAVNEGHKVLVFSQFVSYLEILQKDLNQEGIPYLILTGATNVADRKKRVSAFQNSDEHPVFLISLKAGGTGLNLTAADYVFLVDPWWNPAVEAQARDRSHRIGQLNKVFSYKFISAETVEEKIVQLQKQKKKIATDIIQVEENIIKSLSAKDLTDFFG